MAETFDPSLGRRSPLASVGAPAYGASGEDRARRGRREAGRGEGARGSSRGGAARCRSHLVEAGAAVDRPVGPRVERDDGLPATHAADRGVVLARATRSPGLAGSGPTARAALGDVLEALPGEEGLFARREDELLSAVAADERSVFVHGLASLLEGPGPAVRRPPSSTRPPSSPQKRSEGPTSGWQDNEAVKWDAGREVERRSTPGRPISMVGAPPRPGNRPAAVGVSSSI